MSKIKQYKKEVKEAYKVISGQKSQSTITPKESSYLIQFTNDVLIMLKTKHPDKVNIKFNEALGFIKTLHYPDKLQNVPEKQRINYLRKLTGKYAEKLNRVIIKAIENKQQSYINTSHLVGRKQRVNKLLSEGLASPSSPVGVGAKLPTSKARLIIPFPVNKHRDKKQ